MANWKASQFAAAAAITLVVPLAMAIALLPPQPRSVPPRLLRQSEPRRDRYDELLKLRRLREEGWRPPLDLPVRLDRRLYIRPFGQGLPADLEQPLNTRPLGDGRRPEILVP